MNKIKELEKTEEKEIYSTPKGSLTVLINEQHHSKDIRYKIEAKFLYSGSFLGKKTYYEDVISPDINKEQKEFVKDFTGAYETKKEAIDTIKQSVSEIIEERQIAKEVA